MSKGKLKVQKLMGEISMASKFILQIEVNESSNAY